jgi:hypothetical protein
MEDLRIDFNFPATPSHKSVKLITLVVKMNAVFNLGLRMRKLTCKNILFFYWVIYGADKS